MVDVIQRQLFARRDHVNTIVLESPKVCAGTRSSIFKISLVWLAQSRAMLKPGFIYWLLISAGNGAANLNRLHHAVPNNEAKGDE